MTTKARIGRVSTVRYWGRSRFVRPRASCASRRACVAAGSFTKKSMTSVVIAASAAPK